MMGVFGGVIYMRTAPIDEEKREVYKAAIHLKQPSMQENPGKIIIPKYR